MEVCLIQIFVCQADTFKEILLPPHQSKFEIKIGHLNTCKDMYSDTVGPTNCSI